MDCLVILLLDEKLCWADFVQIVTIISLKDCIVVHWRGHFFGWIFKKSGKLTLKILIHFKIINLLWEVKKQRLQSLNIYHWKVIKMKFLVGLILNHFDSMYVECYIWKEIVAIS